MLETILGYSPKRILKNIRPSASKIQGAQPAPDREDGAGCAPWISEAGDSFVHVSGCTKESGIPSSPSTHRQFTIQHAADVRLALVLVESVHTVAHPAKQLVESPVAYRGGCCTRRYAQRNAGPHRSADTSLIFFIKYSDSFIGFPKVTVHVQFRIQAPEGQPKDLERYRTFVSRQDIVFARN